MIQWEIVNQTRLRPSNAVPTPLLALEVQCGSMPGPPGAGLCATALVEVVLAMVMSCSAHVQVTGNVAHGIRERQ